MAQIAARTKKFPQSTAPDQQALLGFDNPAPKAAARPDELPAHQSLGLALGWDFAQHGLTPPVEHLFKHSPLQQGWQAGRATFGHRSLRSHSHAGLWLQLRTHAWARGRSFEDVQLTPNFLQQIDVSHCPITRQELKPKAGPRQQRSIDRVRNDAGYAAGNIVTMSRAANTAKAQHDWASAQSVADSVEQGPIQNLAGLGPAEWRRIAVLCSFVTELPHEEAARIPLSVLPPNRLRLFNPIQALQALVTRQLAKPGWSQRLARIESLLPSEGLRADFNRFIMALAPRVLAVKELDQEQQIRWALEDAWQQPLLIKRWTRFASQLTAAQAEALVARAAAKGLSTLHVMQHSTPNALEGWALENKGFCPRGAEAAHAAADSAGQA
ncbi:hypothetical protein HNP55_004618 [Paucibacter oligotrophus]|uniref:Uncharacterized protein n=1 Tax=Roseateles oligotrophus TaxID=1769250 RepID=A0A840LBS7_9BURK|nr:hypothetical protein [Roseateles oligotrophus]MBB4846064.1 hypothetical protein [Roseateles oligotrophus]